MLSFHKFDVVFWRNDLCCLFHETCRHGPLPVYIGKQKGTKKQQSTYTPRADPSAATKGVIGSAVLFDLSALLFV